MEIPTHSNDQLFLSSRSLPTGSRAAEAQEANLNKTQLKASAEASPALVNKWGAK